MRTFRALLAGLSLLLLSASAGAEDFPARQIRLIVPFPAGGPSDIIARVIGQRMAEIAKQFAARFEEKHLLRLDLTPDAIEALVDGAFRDGRNMRDHCAVIFKDFEFGLKLISKNSGQTSFTIDRSVVEAPDQAMSRWVVASYKPTT